MTQELTVLRKIALRKLVLLSLNFRRIRDGTIEIYIVLNGNYDREAAQYMELWNDIWSMTVVREYILKIYPQRENIEIIMEAPIFNKIFPNLEHIAIGNRQ